jgi:hypothetical protein
MKMPTNITIELFCGDPTKDHDGWRAVATWTDPRTGAQIGANYFKVGLFLEEVLADISANILNDIEIINAVSKPCGCLCDCRCEEPL